MTNLERRIMKLETQRDSDNDIAIEIVYGPEPPQGLRTEGRGSRVTTVYLNEDDRNL